MERMDRNTEGQDLRLDALFAEYRGAFPAPEAGANFMPGLWQKIDARRADPMRTLRRFARVCAMAAAAVVLILAISAARMQRDPAMTTNYVDVLNAQHAADYIEVADAL